MPSTVVYTTADGEIMATFDGGRTYQKVYANSVGQTAAPATFVGFTDSRQGVAIIGSSHNGTELVITHNGGHSWAPVQFQLGAARTK